MIEITLCKCVRKWRILNIRVRVYSWGNTYITFTFSKWGIFQSVATVDVGDKNIKNSTTSTNIPILVLLTLQHAIKIETGTSVTKNSKAMKLSWAINNWWCSLLCIKAGLFVAVFRIIIIYKATGVIFMRHFFNKQQLQYSLTFEQGNFDIFELFKNVCY